MPHDSDMEIDEMMEEMAEDLGRSRELEMNDHHSSVWTNFSSGWPFLLVGLVLVILIAIVFSILLRGKGIAEGDLRTITEGLGRIEKRLAKLETIETKTVEFEKQIQELRTSVSELKRFQVSSDRTFSVLTQKIEQNYEKIRGVTSPQKNSSPISTKLPAGEDRHHIVKKGETLFGISQRYGLKVDELRRMNQLKSDDNIYPGQKLVIAP